MSGASDSRFVAATIVATFVLALVLRLAIVMATPQIATSNTDLEMYRMGGILVARGVDAYDPRDHMALRAQLRAATHSATFRLTQGFWDYGAGSLLPLNLLVLGAVARISDAPVAFRIAFAIADSIFAALAMLWILRRWRASRLEAIGAGLTIGALSLVMLHMGTYSPEDKGIELLLMVTTLVAIDSPSRRSAIVGAPLWLGLACAYKATGACLAPYVAYRLWARRDVSYGDLLLAAGMFSCASLAWFVPYISDMASMLTRRVGDDLNVPRFASPFVLVASPDTFSSAQAVVVRRALYARAAVTGAFAAAMTAALWRRRLDAELATAIVLMVFCTVLLVAGGLDRLNIALAVAALLIGVHHRLARRIAVTAYAVLGAANLVLYQRARLSSVRIEAMFIAVCVAALLVWLVVLCVVGETVEPRPVVAPPQTVPNRTRERLTAAACCGLIALLTVVGARANASTPDRVDPALWTRNPFLGGWALRESPAAVRSSIEPIELDCEEHAGQLSLVLREGVLRRAILDQPISLDGRDHAIEATAWRGKVLSITRLNEYIADIVITDSSRQRVYGTGSITASPYYTWLTLTLTIADEPALSGTYTFEKY